MPGTISTNTDALTKFARNLRLAYPHVNNSLRRTVAEAGRLIRDDAKTRAGFSVKIPPTIRSSASATTATITAGNKAVPIARLYEMPSGWRHPLFGNTKQWYGGPGEKSRQGPHPYLRPALEANRDRAKQMILDGVTQAISDTLGGD